jgi:hypothetical protein
VLPSSSLASITPSPKVGGLCVLATPILLLAWLCLGVCCPCSRPAQGECSVPVGPG